MNSRRLLPQNERARSPEPSVNIHWLCAGLMTLADIFLRGLVKQQDQLDPLPPDFKWKGDREDESGKDKS